MTKFLASLTAVFLAVSLASPLVAAPTRYTLDAKASRVGFNFSLGGGQQKGTMPVSHAVILVDPENLAASRVDISVDVAKVRTPLPFVRPALIGPEVLDAAKYPTIRFVSNKVQLAPDGRLSGGATISGKLTMHGVTRPVTFQAALFRAPGSAPNDLSNLTVELSGQVSRAAFGAAGFPDLVADTIGINIFAVISVSK
jgi:polyisoprenoid-binding protein YceI